MIKTEGGLQLKYLRNGKYEDGDGKKFFSVSQVARELNTCASQLVILFDRFKIKPETAYRGNLKLKILTKDQVTYLKKMINA